MKIVVQLKLTPSPEQAAALEATLHAVNSQANWVSEVAHREKAFRNFVLRKHTYAAVRAAGIGSHAAQHVIKKVADAYTTLRANIRAGNYGKPGSKQRRKESRRVRDINHCISKTIVAEAERTSNGIALEDLGGIRQRVRLRKPQRVTLHSWAFAQLGDFIVYKARRAGVPLVFVDPAHTSRTCAECGHIDKKNRVSQALFTCHGCGFVAHADRNASHNIARRGRVVWDAGRTSHVPATQPAS